MLSMPERKLKKEVSEISDGIRNKASRIPVTLGVNAVVDRHDSEGLGTDIEAVLCHVSEKQIQVLLGWVGFSTSSSPLLRTV